MSRRATARSYCYPGVLSDFELDSGEKGVDGLLAAIDELFDETVRQIPQPLPTDYPVEALLAQITQQIVTLENSKRRETWVPACEPHLCSMVKLGVIPQNLNTMKTFDEKLEESKDDYCFADSINRPVLAPFTVAGSSMSSCEDGAYAGDVPAAVEFGRVAAAPVNTLRQQTHRCQEISVCF